MCVNNLVFHFPIFKRTGKTTCFVAAEYMESIPLEEDVCTFSTLLVNAMISDSSRIFA